MTMHMHKSPSVMLLIDTSRVYGLGIFRGVTKYARLHGPWTFHNSLSFFGKTMAGLPRFDSLGLDGLILFTEDRKILARALKSGLPLVMRGIKGPVPGVPNIISDNQEAGARAADHLLSLGLNHLAFCGYFGVSWSKERELGFCREALSRGHTPGVYRQPRALEKRRWHQEKMLIMEWLRALPKPTGLLCTNDDRGQQVIEACRSVGLRIPEDCAVIGVDNDEILCEQSNPPLSSVARNFEEAGYHAAELLEQAMAGQDVSDRTVIIHPTDIMARQSTDILAINDPDVARAVRFIRQASHSPLTVENVLETVVVSRGHLDRRFLQILGHPIHHEITRARIERITRLLLETNRSVTQIACHLGFNGPDRISRYFQRHQGMSPTEYRHRHGRI
jgi:LacI family transcriptional regulator